MSTQYKKLYRSRENRVLGGVCGGLGEYFDIDPTLVRLLFVFGAFLGVPGALLLIYLVMLVNVPQGGLLVILIDGRSGFVIWVGAATAEIQQTPSAKTVKARLDYAVTQVFRKLPK